MGMSSCPPFKLNPLRSVVALIALSLQFCLIGNAEERYPPSEHEVLFPDDLSAIDVLVSQLGSDVYRQRARASESLRELGASLQDRPDKLFLLTSRLRAAANNRMLEIAIEIEHVIESIMEQSFEYEHAKLLDSSALGSDVSIHHWKEFKSIVGADINARRFFAGLAMRNPNFFQVRSDVSEPTTGRLTLSPLIPYSLDCDDAIGWATLLLLDCHNNSQSSLALRSRILMSLAHSNLGPHIRGDCNDQPLLRLLRHWVLKNHGSAFACERLLVAMRYGFHDMAEELVHDHFACDASVPAWRATAILAATRLCIQPDNSLSPSLHNALHSHLSDSRVVHIWQVAPSKRTWIRTQLRDVALACLLFRSGIDPREVGFSELQAHPWLLYRDHSLGFASEAERERAHRSGIKLLQSATKAAGK